MKSLIKKYLRFMWFHSQAYNLLTIPVNGLGVVLSFFTLVAVAFNLKFAWWEYGLFFIFVVLCLVSAGYLMVSAGLTAYYQSLNNSQSPELMKILEKIEGLERKMK